MHKAYGHLCKYTVCLRRTPWASEGCDSILRADASVSVGIGPKGHYYLSLSQQIKTQHCVQMRVLVGVAALLVCVLGFITPTSCLADTGVQVSPAQAQEEAELLDIPEDLDIDVAGFFRALFDDDDDDGK